MLGGQEPRQRSWTQWGGRRWLKFSLAVAIPFAVSTVLWELAAPRWAGDRIGLSFGACLFYLVADLIWVATLNVVYALVWVSETLINPSRRENYRRWAYPIVVAIGAGSGPAWIASVVVAGWLRRP